MTQTLASATRPHLYSRPVRMSDLDSFNHVNNVRLLEMIQDAHMDLLYLQQGRPGQEVRPSIVYTRHELDYTEPLVPEPEPVTIRTTVTSVRRASFHLVSRITRGPRTFCTCASTLVAYDLTARCSRRLDEGELAVLGRHTAVETER
ncbi:acyl-CoA thioesterase [Streptomyces phaeofaciens]|uniref:acyl-CoA thioesterase n=1 Tax=Streptomyces phaeofaciens TaxID=68254 RepID=UPI00368A8F7C